MIKYENMDVVLTRQNYVEQKLSFSFTLLLQTYDLFQQ